jgi:hypothetical protein
MKVPYFISALLRLSFVWMLFFLQTNIAYSQSWNNVGDAGFSASTANYTSLAFDGSTPYIAYQDAGNASKATVKKFDGTSWVTVGTAGFSAATTSFTSLALDGSTPYVAYNDGGNSNKATVKKFDGANWVTVGIAGFSGGPAGYLSLVFNGSTPYLSYADNSVSGKATVKKFDGLNWVTVGSVGFSAGQAYFTSLAFEGSTPYVAYRDGSNSFKATVMKFDGANWVTVGSAGFSASTATYGSLAFDGSTPYIAYQDAGNSSKATVQKFDGTNWVTVGTAGFSAGTASYTSLAFHGSTPYIAYNDVGNNNKATVMKFDGANWVAVGSAGFSAGTVTYNSLAFNGSTPYLAYRDAGNSNKASVSKFDITPATALRFDGSNDYVSLPASTPVPTGNSNYTIEAWIKPTAMGDYGIIGWGSYGTVNTVNALRLTATGVHNYWWGNDLTVTTGSLVGAWHHVAATFDGTTRKIYVDGVLLGSDIPVGTHAVPDASNLAIGVTNFAEYFPGSIDEVRVWDRALCQSEIQNNMNCGLNATNQTGLQALYGFNQGFSGANNSTITTLTNASGYGINGTLNNFALSGTTSNWITGKVSSTCSAYTPLLMAATAGGSQVCQSATVQTPGTIYQDASCNLIAKVNPSGASPVSGTINTCVIIDNAVQTYNSQPYVQRHYDIEPATGAATATGTITLTFTQAEFDAYNTARGSLPALPTSAADATGINNLVVTQYHGTGTAPGNYTGTTVMINPFNTNIVWNATQSRWEVTFNVTGFSGFYVQTTTAILPVKLLSFTAGKTAGMNLLKWTTTEEINTDIFEVERNTGNGFEKTGIVKAAGNSGIEKQYAFEDKQPFAGTNNYRLKMVDKDGSAEYSKIVTVQNDGRTGISIYPNPVQSTLYVEGATNRISYQIKNTSGQVLITGRLNNTEGINLSTLSTGIYILVVNGVSFKFFKQ